MSARAGRLEDGLWRAGSLLVIGCALQIVWIVSLSLKPAAHLNDGRFLPRSPSLEHYRAIFSDALFPAVLGNPFVIAVISTLPAVLLGMFAAYAIVRLRFRGRRLVLVMFLIFQRRIVAGLTAGAVKE